MERPTVSTMLELSKQELIAQIESSLEQIKVILCKTAENREAFEKVMPGPGRHIKINIHDWNNSDKELLWLHALRGVYYYNFILTSEQKSLDLGSYNSIKSSMNGAEEIWLYTKGIKWYPEHIRFKIKEQGHTFEELTPRIWNNYSSKSTGDSYFKYGGPSDGYGGYLDDDFIDDALDGDPSAIWNLD